MAKLSKEERKSRVKQWQAAERAALVESMPFSVDHLSSLLDYLDANLKSCDHTTKLTEIFLHVNKLDKDLVLKWLAEHGGFCDCEVLFNLVDLVGSLCGRPARHETKPKTKSTGRDLTTTTGWDFTSLPRPWRIANSFIADEPLKLQLGKKTGCTVTLHESSMPPGDPMTDEYWSVLWYALTGLPKKAPIQVTRRALDLPSHLQSTLVQTPKWLPVYCWVVPEGKQWYLEIHTAQNRQRNDLPQSAKLITELASNVGGQGKQGSP